MPYTDTREEDRAPINAFASSIRSVFDPSKVDMHYVQTQTAWRSSKAMIRWADRMHEHETNVPNSSERVYLVVSDLKLKMSSQRYSSGSMRRQAGRLVSRRDYVYLPDKNVRTLHEKHWAIEINGVYYELVQKHNRSHFSSSVSIEENDREIVARIFVGTTHCQYHALRDIGMSNYTGSWKNSR